MSHGSFPHHGIFEYGTLGSRVGHLPQPQTRVEHGDLMSMLDSSTFDSMDDIAINMDVMEPQTPDAMTTQSAVPLPGVPTLKLSATDEMAMLDLAGERMSTPTTPVPSLCGPSSASSSGLTDFTKKRDWAAKTVGELQDLLSILDSNARLRHVSPSITALTGWKSGDVVDRFLRDFMHPDDTGLFMSEFNESIATANPLRLYFRFRRKDGTFVIFESVGHAHIAAAKFAPNPSNQSHFCQAVFMMSRPYPTKNARMLDSFLEHKIENERLQRRIAELQREETQDTEASQRTWDQSLSEVTPSDDTPTMTLNTPFRNRSPDMMPPPLKAARRASSSSADLNAALTRENLEGMASSRPDSIREKMARFAGMPTPVETIEMLTGLRWQEGERSQGISTGNLSPFLIKGDAGIAISMDRDPRTGERKKKHKVAEEYVCTDCGTLESPEWRKGPSGPKTLCNACGLRWAKKEKKRSKDVNNGGTDSGAVQSGA